MRSISQGKFFSKLKNFKVLDSSGDLVGRVGDLMLRKSDLSVYALISHDSALKERLESLKILNDKDEIIPLHHIDREIQMPNEIRTTIKKKKLRTTSTNWDIPEEYYMFSDLCKVNVVDVNGDLIGHITDIIYHEGEEYSIVVDPATYIQHFLEVLHLRHHHEIVIPGDYIDQITDDQVNIGIDRHAIEKIDALPVHQILQKDRNNFSQQAEKVKKRYHYYVLQAPTYLIQERFVEKEKKLQKAKELLEIVPFDSSDSHQIVEFCQLFNEVALTSVDPYEQMTQEDISKHFARNSYLAYYMGNPVGYAITTIDLEQSIAAIAGIGIHHKHRGKRFSSVLMKEMVDTFEEEGMEFVQCDVLTKNDASLGLFQGLGFNQIDDFYLT